MSHIPKATAGFNLMQRLKLSKSLTWQEIMGSGILAEQGLHFSINLDLQIFEFIAGAEILEYMSFELPENIRFAALQKSNLFHNIIVISKMLTECNDVIQQLSVSQVSHVLWEKILCIK